MSSYTGLVTTSADTSRSTLVRAIAEGQRDQRGALLPILHEVMEECGFIDSTDVPVIADVLNLSVAEVHGVVSFYHDFRTTPPADHTIALCRAEACQSVGAQVLYDETLARVTDGDLPGSVDVHEVFCLGNCALGPAGMIDGRLYGALNRARIDEITSVWSNA